METPQELLAELGLINPDTVIPFYPKVRDRDDVSVLKDETSGVIFLSRMDHMDISHYEEMQGVSYWSAKDRKETLQLTLEDDRRRARQFSSLVRGKNYIDIGCGAGGVLDQLRDTAKGMAGVEPQEYIRAELSKQGYTMSRLASDVPKRSFDVASLFHVLEHITTPLETLKQTRGLLCKGGRVIVEVPHARDALLKLESFKGFTLWSEHIVLYTRQTLQKLLEHAGFKDVHVEGFQRYPLANHIGWLVYGKPGGQNTIHITAPEYKELLTSTDQTDTIIATATA